MRATLKTLFRWALLVVATGPAVAAAPPAHPEVGTWKLNLAKSVWAPGPAPRSQFRIYSESAQGMTLTLRTTAADGKQTTTTATFKEDGTPAAVSGNPEYDIVSAKRLDALTVQSILMTAGKTVGIAVRAVSKDGKTLTFAQKGTNANGVMYDSVVVYDRQ
jgi:hypothetical protein